MNRKFYFIILWLLTCFIVGENAFKGVKGVPTSYLSSQTSALSDDVGQIWAKYFALFGLRNKWKHKKQVKSF